MEGTNICIGGINQDSQIASKKPLMLSSQKWHSILKNLNQNEEIIQQSEQDRKYKEYLKEGSHELTKNWPNMIEKSAEYKAVDRKKRMEEKVLEGERIYNELKENSQKIRQEQIAKAQQMIQRLKVGPRELDSAAILSEVLKGREIQRNINAEYNKALKEQKLKEDMKMQMQAIPWIEEEQRRIVESRKRAEEYKHELIRTIKDDEKRRVENVKRQTESERKLRKQADREIKAQIEKERAILQRKKEAMRKNALEAMKMVEQRRLREKFENEIDNQLNAIFNKGKETISDIKTQKEKEMKVEKIKKTEINAQKLAQKIVDEEAIEKERIQKAVDEFNVKFQQQENQRLQKEKFMKAQRIKFHMEELERQKALKAQQYEQFQSDVANRLRNDEVSEEFEKQRIQEKIKHAQEIRAILDEQTKEKETTEKKLKEFERKLANVTSDDDKFFFEYANKLIQEAKNKSRPLLPLLKAVDKYKKQNEIDIDRQLPRHLKSNVPIGDNQPCDMKSKQSIIKYNLKELKKMNPYDPPPASVWT